MIEYYNLSAGLMALKNKHNPRFIRIQSSHLESHAWDRLFYGLSDDLLYNLAIGIPCRIIDCTSNGTGKVIKTGIPAIRYILWRIWYDRITAQPPISPAYCNEIYRQLSRQTKRKLRYYKKHLQCPVVFLAGKSIHVTKED